MPIDENALKEAVASVGPIAIGWFGLIWNEIIKTRWDDKIKLNEINITYHGHHSENISFHELYYINFF